MPTKSKGGAGPYRKGAAHENEVARFFETLGYFAIRSPKSASPIDLLVVAPGHRDSPAKIYWVQCKLGGYMRPAEVAAVVGLADTYGGTPLLAGGRSPIVITDLRTGNSLGEFEPVG